MGVCVTLDPEDGLPLMEVGDWSEDKHELIRKFVDASWAARRRWPQRTYVDLFCGPGKVLIRDSNQIRNGSPLVAWEESCSKGGAFTDVIVADLNQASLDACTTRLKNLGAPVRSFSGPADTTVDSALPFLRMDSGLHLVVLDPFSMGPLHFSILQKLSKLRHVDIILHFSVMDLQRNIDSEFTKEGGLLEGFAPNWKVHVNVQSMGKEAARIAYWEYWVSLVRSLGFKVASRSPLFTNSNQGPLYRLALLYRDPLAHKLWDAVAKPRSGQKELF